MPALLLLLFLAVPILELYVILQVADVIGGWQTLAVLIAESFLGTWLVRNEGRRTWRAFQSAVEAHRPPAREVADGALVIVGGTLLLTPGFLSDIVGFFVLLPITRPLARRLLLRIAARRVGARLGMAFGPSAGRGPGRGGRGGPGAGRGRPGTGEVVEGEVLDERITRRPGERTDRLTKRPDDGTPPNP
jgi:UPF0716 protein FxsA